MIVTPGEGASRLLATCDVVKYIYKRIMVTVYILFGKSLVPARLAMRHINRKMKVCMIL